MYYPLMLDIRNRNVVVVGGGKVAFRKTKKLLEFGANVILISPQLINEFNDLKKIYLSKLNIIIDCYNDSYIKNSYLVIGATSNKSINKKISVCCKEKNILCNIVDDINSSDFIVPSSVKRGDLVISISTMGKSPMLAAKIKQEIEKKYSNKYEEYIVLLGEARNIVIRKFKDDAKKEILKNLINMSLDEIKIFIKENR
ncbi:precorrin-2 dehydrogenase/sirohydrochlorin ferrochelatase family protein [Clostridium botulinum]|uniref:precorrin-2 dehydrogenase n=2 Tax=Clostridium botulinum TaxID=1491 RepID=A0A9Q1UW18_CLOBO|nr:bifunctional precorrin-2 dehydrogenase/sirohydrochlorin ferrochelatase [Clostridium botulinum]KEI04809.1 siroheme synthase [Clostridium botulinum D str. 16868]KEI00915.1 siroheme synthase [Clostridium botulinum C/D str. Sp77]KLU76847.1 siroheme synthase [Clostridium botulinum V891]KOA74212.1 siroheme synthase [Clostridium botulinum]KOA75115.1 siroheme synthase [Clostridium botulinum]